MLANFREMQVTVSKEVKGTLFRSTQFYRDPFVTRLVRHGSQIYTVPEWRDRN